MINGTQGGKDSPADTNALRQRAEKIAGGKSFVNLELMTPEEIRAALHELYVHQIELEMQNEELRRSQEEIETVRAQYFDLYDMAPVGYCTLSDKGIILQANLTVANHLGATRTELIHKTFSRYIYKEDQDVYYLHKKGLSEGSKPRPFELRMKRNDGTIFWANIDATALQQDGQQLYRITISDITERRKAEDALHESERKYRVLFDSIDEGFCIVEVLFDDYERPIDCRLLEVNQAFERQTGLVDPKGRLMRDMAPDHEQHWFDTYGRIALTGEPARFQNSAVALGRFYDVYAFRIGKPEQRRVAILFNNITAFRQAQEAQRESEENLRS